MELLYGYSVVAELRPGTRYDEVVTALGGHGELVSTPAELRPALERAFASDLPAVVNTLTDPQRRLPTPVEPRLTSAREICAGWRFDLASVRRRVPRGRGAAGRAGLGDPVREAGYRLAMSCVRGPLLPRPVSNTTLPPRTARRRLSAPDRVGRQCAYRCGTADSAIPVGLQWNTGRVFSWSGGDTSWRGPVRASAACAGGVSRRRLSPTRGARSPGAPEPSTTKEMALPPWGLCVRRPTSRVCTAKPPPATATAARRLGGAILRRDVQSSPGCCSRASGSSTTPRHRRRPRSSSGRTAVRR